ncbi:hypothetical protein SDC9_202744 [bioreactor metagenome]|uniref:Uncharacterized protein n=1 Tax=bioreactor metagenome TaxID=1076179 RepID=A0A645IUG9_9ZZZZ
MYLGLRPRDPPKHVQHPGFYFFRKPARADQSFNILQLPVGMAVFMYGDVHFGAGDAFFLGPAHRHFKLAVQVELGKFVSECLLVRTQVQQGAQIHVPADPAKTVVIQYLHSLLSVCLFYPFCCSKTSFTFFSSRRISSPCGQWVSQSPHSTQADARCVGLSRKVYGSFFPNIW